MESKISLFLLLIVSFSAAAITLSPPSDDTFLDEINPANINGATNVLIVRSINRPGYVIDSLVKFDLSSLPANATVASAHLKLYYFYNNDGDPAGQTFYAYRVTSSWSESTASWNNQPSLSPTATSTITMPATFGWVQWDVAADVKSFIIGTDTNYGWAILSKTPLSDDMTYFHSSNYTADPSFHPILEIELTLPGSGIQADPWRIESQGDFDVYSSDPSFWSGHTRLDTDLALGEYDLAPIAPDIDQTSPNHQGTPFTGVFDGSGHHISSFVIDHDSTEPGNADYDYLALFGKVDYGAVIKDLTMGQLPFEPWSGIDINISTGYSPEYIAVLAGENSGIIQNCSVIARVLVDDDSEFVGGLVGRNDYGAIVNCSSLGLVTAGEKCSYIGGLVGENYAGSSPISYSNSGSTVKADDSSQYVGGLMGANKYSVVTKCFATGKVDIISGNVDYVGGLIGYNASSSNVNNCYALGDVEGDNYVGGLAGRHFYSGITRCFSAGAVVGNTNVGGLIGKSDDTDPDVYNCYWDKNTSGQNTSSGGDAASTFQMRKQATFSTWDFDTIWQIAEDQHYPQIRFFNLADMNSDGIVNLFDFEILAANWLIN